MGMSTAGCLMPWFSRSGPRRWRACAARAGCPTRGGQHLKRQGTLHAAVQRMEQSVGQVRQAAAPAPQERLCYNHGTSPSNRSASPSPGLHLRGQAWRASTLWPASCPASCSTTGSVKGWVKVGRAWNWALVMQPLPPSVASASSALR